MTPLVNVRLSGVFLIVSLVGFALSSCGGTASTPSAQNAAQSQRSDSGGDARAQAMRAATGCPPPFGTFGVTYLVLQDTGNVKNGTFVPILGRAIWLRAIYSKGSTPPPTTPPHSTSLYVYRGTYNDPLTHTTGCAVLITTQNGSPLKAFGGANASDSEAPAFKTGINARPVGAGAITALTITNLNASGGRGTYKLSDGTAGKITFTLRQSVP